MPDEQRVAVVTGSSKGIGRGLAERFLEQGYRVAGCSRGDAPPLDGPYEHARVDVRNEEEVRRWITQVGSRAGRIDVLVNNAGVSLPALALVTSGASAEDALRTNVMGTFLVSREAAKVMLRRKWGRIINISSMAAAVHMPGTAVYAASKGAIAEMSKVLARELASFSITVNVVAPSIVETEMLAALGPEVVEACRQALAIKRLCTLDDISGVVSFLASDAASYLTGQVLYLGYVA